MPFVSVEFLVALPLALLAYYGFRRLAPASSVPLIILLSIAFIAQDGLRALIILSVSVLANYAFARLVVAMRTPNLAIVGVVANLLYLGYFKYFDFLIGQFLELGGPTTILPLGISFYTFHQVAFLLDLRSRRLDQLPRFRDYVAFVFFFPQLVAGPIVRAEQFFPQLPWLNSLAVPPAWILAGTAAFLIGLAKKTVLADNLARYATPVFDAASAGTALTPGDSWIGALAYTFQLYFDFSGYSDMAVGLALLLGIRLPFNFDAPYKAASIAEFWRRWHITLSTFLRDYLYVPLGGSRATLARQCLNVFIVMLVCGLWHGAGWTFVAWGALHGLALVAHRLWRSLIDRHAPGWDAQRWYRPVSMGLTFLFVTLAWVLFRASDFEAASIVYAGMTSTGEPARTLLLSDDTNIAILLIALSVIICTVFPSLPQMLGTSARQERDAHAVGSALNWRPSALRAVGLGLLGFLSVTFLQEGYSEFIYFNF